MSGEDGFPTEKECVNLEEAHTKVKDMLSKIEETTSSTKEAYALDKPLEKRYKGRRRRISVNDNIGHLSTLEQRRDIDIVNSANSSRSSGYHSQLDMKENMSIGRIGEVADDFGDEGNNLEKYS